MKICVFGAGAIGGHVAGRLAKGGADVSLVLRGANLAAIRERGLEVRAGDGVHHSRPKASADPAELGVQDAVIVTVKAPALPSVAASIAPLIGPNTAVAFVMNGIPWWYFDKHGGPMDGKRLPQVDPGNALRDAVGVERTIGGVVYSACTVIEPGIVNVASPTNRVILGELDGSISPRAQAIAALLEAGGMGCPVSDDIRKEVWGKLMGNLSGGPLCLLSRRTIAETLSDPVVLAAAIRMTDEGGAIAAALGRDVGMGGADRVGRSLKTFHKPSILQDLELGRPMEVEALFRLPLELGRMAGVPTPTLDLAIALATHAAIAAGLYTPLEGKAV
ncbi:2-dehydropantoate 2-reductase [Humitalea rosea]|uniref:2-dehydropantoate 2-reductase n=1 Tax=Humitalea rosea TaxID=990373 RepID=A0A2W7INB4_9PROT|nr:2-dehydropantoate 2-reductase [Humitalea rosea]PZW48443.1 2-dehydropantoate 2-reductase [Humitalea rosea]